MIKYFDDFVVACGLGKCSCGNQVPCQVTFVSASLGLRQAFCLLMDFCFWLVILKTNFWQTCSRCRETIEEGQTWVLCTLNWWHDLLKIHSSDLENEPHVNWSWEKSSPVHGVFLLHGMTCLRKTEFHASVKIRHTSSLALHCLTASCTGWVLLGDTTVYSLMQYSV